MKGKDAACSIVRDTKMENNNLEIVVERVSSGDIEAFRELCNMTYTGSIYQANAILRNYHDAEEAVQNVMLRVYDKIETLREPTAFKAWLHKMIVNECINMKRKSDKRKADIPYEEERDQRMEDTNEWLPEAHMEKSEYSELFSKIIDTLPAQRKMAITLYYYEELSYKEIAEVMNISMGNVASTITRAKKYLKEEMKKIADIDIEFDDEREQDNG